MKEEFLAKLDIDGDGKEFFQENDFFLKFCNYGFKEKHFNLSATWKKSMDRVVLED